MKQSSSASLLKVQSVSLCLAPGLLIIIQLDKVINIPGQACRALALMQTCSQSARGQSWMQSKQPSDLGQDALFLGCAT